jgi:quinol monooxygenase YgiN
MGHMVIVVYRPRAGKEAQLLDVLREHVPILRAEGLATDRAPLVLRAKDGSMIEVFEWASAEAVDRAHTNPAVLAMWGRFEEACTYEKLASLPEANDLFAHFDPVDF